MNVGGETLQLSFGPAANATTSHLCNLQGLAATTTSTTGNNFQDDDPSSAAILPLCDPYITHSIQRETYVPRVLFVDGRNHFSQWPSSSTPPVMMMTSSEQQQQQQQQQRNDDHSNHQKSHDSALVEKYVQKSSWGGDIDIHHRTPYQKNSSLNSNNDNSTSFIDTNTSNIPLYNLNSTQQNALYQFQTLSSTITNTSSNIKSRYHSSKYKHVSSQFVYSQSNNLVADSTGRCMQWDDEEEEEEEEEDEYYKMRRKQLEEQKWNEEEMNIQSDLSHAWDTFFTGGTTIKGSTSVEEQESSLSNRPDGPTTQHSGNINNPLQHLQWFNYFMPPHPHFNMYTSPLPFDYMLNQKSTDTSTKFGNTNKSNQSILYSHYSGRYSTTSSSSNSIVDGITNEWRDELSDKVRKWMEECDALKGIQIMVDNDKSLFGGLATSVLEELNDECKSAGKFTILVHDGNQFDSDEEQVIPEVDQNNTYWRSERKVVDTFRSQLNNGLNLHGVGEYSDLVLPLSLSNCWNALSCGGQSSPTSCGSLFECAAVAALALESTTLSYRLLKESSTGSSSSSTKSKIGIMNGYYQGSGQSDNDAFPSTDRMSFHEFLSSLRPSNSHTMLELSSCLKNNEDLYNRLLQGTSVERRKLEEERERNRNSMYYRRSRGRDIEPGLWLEDSGVGVMTPLTPIDEKLASRSIHRHFSLATSYRPKSSPSTKNQLSTITSLTMEGMSIRYRPQCSVSTVVNQSLSDLTSSRSYAAGSYWKSIFKGDTSNIPILTTVGNTTRVYSHLSDTSKNMSSSLSRKYQGYLRRDCMGGMVPEHEDCSDALEHCLRLKDTYEPPMMFDDDEGNYFEDNTE